MIPVRARTAEGDERTGAVEPHARAVARLRRLPGQHRPRDPGRGARATLTPWATTTRSTALGSAGCSTSPARSTRREAAGSPPIRTRRSTGCASRGRCTRASSGRWSASPARGSSRGSRTRTVRTGRRSTGPRATRSSATARPTCRSRRRRTRPASPTPASSTWTVPSTGATAPWCSRRSSRSARRGGPSAGSSVRSTRCSSAWSRTARADLNVEFFSAIPLLTITGSLGVSVADALDIREAVTSDGLGIQAFARIVPPIVQAAARNRATTSSACWSRPRSPRRTAAPTASPTKRC